MRRFHEAKVEERPEVVVWGTGKPLREFLHVDDLARGVAYCLDNYDEYMHINCGAGSEISIKELAGLLARIVGYRGKITFDTSKPDGTPRKLMDSSRLIALGWTPEISLENGIKQTYEWFLKNAPAPATMAAATA
jgi:GDP-L-fucose synthase